MNWWDEDQIVRRPSVVPGETIPQGPDVDLSGMSPEGMEDLSAATRAERWWEDDTPVVPHNPSLNSPEAHHRPLPYETDPVPEGSMARVGASLLGGMEDIGLGAMQLGNDVLKGPGSEEMGETFSREARDMELRKAPLYDTTEGTIGAHVLPSLMFPGATIPKAIGSGIAYGLMQPQEKGGERAKEAILSGAAFGAGSGLANLAVKGVTKATARIRSPLYGTKTMTETERELGKKADAAEALGLRVTAGQRSGSEPLQTAESVISQVPFIGKKVSKIGQANTEQSNRLLAKEIGVDATLLTDDVLEQAKGNIGKVFDSVAANPTPIKYDKAFLAEGRKLKEQIELLDEGYRTPELVQAVNSLYEKPRALMEVGPASMTGAELKAVRSKIGDQSKRLSRAGEDNAARQLNNVVHALDDMAERSLGPEQSAAYKTARKQWQALKIAEDSVDELGNIEYGKFKNALKKHRPRKGYGDDTYVNLRKGMDTVRKKVPDSGTSKREQMAAYLTGGSFGGAGVGGLAGLMGLGPLGAGAAVAGLGVPLAFRHLLTSEGRLGAKFMSNDAAGRALESPGLQELLSALTRPGSGGGAALLPWLEQQLPALETQQ